MGRGRALASEERAVVIALYRDGKSQREIAKAVNRSQKAVFNVVHNIQRPQHSWRRGAPLKISEHAKRIIIRKGRTGMYFARELRDTYMPNVTVRRVQQILHAAPQLDFIRMKTAPKLTSEHKSRRLEWVRAQLAQSSSRWRKTVFSDEKRFCLDGPDGMAYYWADRRLDPRYFSRRQNGGGGVMVWASFSVRGKSKLTFVDTRLNALKYIEVLEECLLPFLEQKHPNGARFQQDNASVHTAEVTKQFFFDEELDVMPWPARSPDLNPIENLWGMMVRKVYDEFQQYEDVAELKDAILLAWEAISDDVLVTLVNSMPRRCMDVISKRGGPTSY